MHGTQLLLKSSRCLPPATPTLLDSPSWGHCKTSSTGWPCLTKLPKSTEFSWIILTARSTTFVENCDKSQVWKQIFFFFFWKYLCFPSAHRFSKPGTKLSEVFCEASACGIKCTHIQYFQFQWFLLKKFSFATAINVHLPWLRESKG